MKLSRWDRGDFAFRYQGSIAKLPNNRLVMLYDYIDKDHVRVHYLSYIIKQLVNRSLIDPEDTFVEDPCNLNVRQPRAGRYRLNDWDLLVNIKYPNLGKRYYKGVRLNTLSTFFDNPTKDLILVLNRNKMSCKINGKSFRLIDLYDCIFDPNNRVIDNHETIRSIANYANN